MWATSPFLLEDRLQPLAPPQPLEAAACSSASLWAPDAMAAAADGEFVLVCS